MGRVDRFAAWRGAMFTAMAAFVIVAASMASAQELVVTTGTALGMTPQQAPVVVLPDVGSNLVSPQVNLVTPLDVPLSTHGLALVSATRALAGEINQPYIDVIDTSTATLLEQFQLPSPAPNVFYDGIGTLAANPAHTFVLVVSGLNTLWAIAAPFDHTAAVTMVTIPSAVGTAQTRAIAFDPVSGRAYVAAETGIVALDPPYTSVAFTIPSSNGINGTFGPATGNIAMSPDGATLAVTRGVHDGWSPDVRLFHAPFSAASVADVVTIAGAELDGLTFTPDGSQLLVTDCTVRIAPESPRVYVMAAPYSATSTVTTLTFSVATSSTGFEDIDISADGQLAALSGGTTGLPDPIVVLKAPFTPAGFTFHLYPIPALSFPYQQAGRGDGTARFWSAALSPIPPPQIYVDPSVSPSAIGSGLQVTEGNSGTTDAILPIKLGGASAQTVSVDFTTVDGTAKVADNDYIPASGTLTFAPGETTKTITVKVVGDTRYEYDDRFTVVLSNPVNATILGNHPGFSDTAQVVIVNDDTGTALGITTTALPDGVTGVLYSFQLEGGGVTPLTWEVDALDPGLAVDPATGIISGTPIFAGTFSPEILLKDAGGFTASKILTLNVTGPGIPFLVFSNNPLDFGNVAVGSTSVAPRLVAVKNQGAVDLILGSPFLTPLGGNDFTSATGSFACTAGQAIAPSDQCFIYFNFSPQAAGPRSATLTLLSNVAPATITLTGNGTSGTTPTVSIANAASIVEGNTGTTPMTFNVTLSAASAGSTSVHYAATGGTATSGVDYTVAGTGTLTFAPGVTTQTITVNVIGDTLPEPDETVVITLSSASGATLGTATATGTIVNDDVAPPLLTLASNSLDFGDQVIGTPSGPRTVTIRNGGGGNLVLATPFATLAGGDFAYASGPNLCVGGEVLVAAATCNLYVVFTPSTLVARSASVILSSNAADVILVLDGTGVPIGPVTEAQAVPILSPWTLALLSALMAAVAAVRRRT